ncbi:MAG TPA: FUSC family protein [Luteibacter sp.]|jgi:uncharacterized membrane protein YccC|nr:FUSC family protein [Luteibacter sp.]
MRAAAAAHFLKTTAESLRGECSQLSLKGPRALLSAKTVGSVVLSVYLADLFHLEDRWWVALSAFAVVRGEFAVSAWRVADRMVGTAIGALVGALIARSLPESAWMFALALAVIAGLGLYRTIGSPRSYGWILGTVTALLVVGESRETTDIAALALRRVADVGVGVVSSLIVLTVVHGAVYVLRRRGGQPTADPVAQAVAASADPPVGGWTMRRLRALQSLQGAITIGGFGLFVWHDQFPDFPQVLISIVAVLLVPLPALLRGDGESVVGMRMANRLLGCLFAALLAVILLPVIGNIPLLCMLVLAGGVWLAAHIQAGSGATSYVGTQFGIGFIVIFVQDQRWSTDVSAAGYRLLAIVVGLTGLAVVMLATARLRRRLTG